MGISPDLMCKKTYIYSFDNTGHAKAAVFRRRKSDVGMKRYL